MEEVYMSVPFEYRATDLKGIRKDYSVYPVIGENDELWFSFFHDEIAKLISSVGDYLYILMRLTSFVGSAKKTFLIGFVKPDASSLEDSFRRFKAKQMHILNENDFLDITEEIANRGINRRAMKSNSVNHPEYKGILTEWLGYFEDKQNDSARFIENIVGRLK